MASQEKVKNGHLEFYYNNRDCDNTKECSNEKEWRKESDEEMFSLKCLLHV